MRSARHVSLVLALVLAVGAGAAAQQPVAATTAPVPTPTATPPALAATTTAPVPTAVIGNEQAVFDRICAIGANPACTDTLPCAETWDAVMASFVEYDRGIITVTNGTATFNFRDYFVTEFCGFQNPGGLLGCEAVRCAVPRNYSWVPWNDPRYVDWCKGKENFATAFKVTVCKGMPTSIVGFATRVPATTTGLGAPAPTTATAGAAATPTTRPSSAGACRAGRLWGAAAAAALVFSFGA